MAMKRRGMKHEVKQLLKLYNGKKDDVAALLGIGRRHINNLLNDVPPGKPLAKLIAITLHLERMKRGAQQ